MITPRRASAFTKLAFHGLLALHLSALTAGAFSFIDEGSAETTNTLVEIANAKNPDKAARKVLKSIPKDLFPQIVERASSDPHVVLRRSAFRLLATAGENGSQSLSADRASTLAFREEDAGARFLLIGILEKLAASSPKDMLSRDTLIRLLDDQTPKNRGRAVGALETVFQTKKMVPALLHYLQSDAARSSELLEKGGYRSTLVGVLEDSLSLGYVRPFRFRIADVRDLLNNRLQVNEPNGRPLAVVIQAQFDNDEDGVSIKSDKNALYQTSLITSLMTHFRVVLYQPGSIKEMEKDGLEATAKQNFSLFIFSGHSTGDGSQFALSSDTGSGLIDIKQDHIFEELKTRADDGAEVLWDSCDPGSGGPYHVNLLTYTAKEFDVQGHRLQAVIGARGDSALTSVIFHDGRFEFRIVDDKGRSQDVRVSGKNWPEKVPPAAYLLKSPSQKIAERRSLRSA